LIEAAAAGLVVISTGAGGIPYVFHDGVNSLLVAPGDWKAMTMAVLRVLEEAGLAPRLTLAARKIGESCSWQQVRLKVLTVYGFDPAAIAPPRRGDANIDRWASPKQRDMARL
jgi:phenylacetate-CoA ligase